MATFQEILEKRKKQIEKRFESQISNSINEAKKYINIKDSIVLTYAISKNADYKTVYIPQH